MSGTSPGTVAPVRTVIRGLGKTCIAAGLLILLFVAYQLWGTGIAEARSQRELKRQFNAFPGVSTTSTTAPAAVAAATASPPTTLAPLPPAPTGSAVAIIRIPKISVNDAVVEGVGVDDLKKGPGHYPNTPLPGQTGNAAIAGHRTTYGAPFYRLNELSAGDDIFVTTRDGTYDYKVAFSNSVSPGDVAVLDPTSDHRLTLTTCTPRFTASKRLVVVSTLVGAVDPRPSTVRASAPAAIPGDAPPPAAAAGAAVGSLSGQGASTAPAITWAVICAVVWALAWVAGRRWPRWVAYALATPVFLISLWFFFENFARFVPANL
jgi:sortase A